MYRDQNNILSTHKEKENSNEKVYTQTLESLTFHAKDHWIIAYHKGTRKKINRKDLWQKMYCIVRKEKRHTFQIEPKCIKSALQLYQWYDEEKNQNYYYLPKNKANQISSLETRLSTIWKMKIHRTKNSNQYIIHTKGGYEGETLEAIKSETNKIINFFLGLSIIYGKVSIQNEILNNIRIQLPLTGNTVKHKETLDKMITQLQSEQLYCGHNAQTHNKWINYQITISDYEILLRLCKQNKSIEKVRKIHKHELEKRLLESIILQYWEVTPMIKNIVGGQWLIKLLEK